MDDWNQFKAVEENDSTVWDRFAPADEEEDVLSKGLLSLRSQSNKPIQDRLVSEDVKATDTAKDNLLHQDGIASGLKTAAAAANNSYTARLERDLQDFSKPQEAAPAPVTEQKKPESLGEWTRQAVGSFAQYLEEDVADYRKRRAEKPSQDRMGNFGDAISSLGEAIPLGSPLAPLGMGLQSLGKTEAGTGFARGYIGGVETAGAGLRGMGETLEREGGPAFMKKAGEATQAAGEKLTALGIPAAALLRAPAEAMKSLATGKGTEGPSVLKQLGAAIEKQAAYGGAEIPKAKVNSLEEIGWNPKKVGDYTMAKIGEGLGSSSIFFTGGAIGGLPGAGFASFSLGTGEVRQELERAGITDPKLIDQYSYVAGSAIAVLDSVVPAKLMSSLSSGVKKELGKYAVAKIAKSTMQDAASEGVTEAIQEAISIAAVAEAKGDQAAIAAIRDLEARQKAGAVDPEQANERAAYGLLALEALSKDWKRVAEAGVAGALPGAVMGGTGALGQSGRDVLFDDQTRARGGATEAKEGSTEAKQESATETKQDKLAVPPEAQVAEQQAQQDKVSAESIRQWAVEQYGQTARVYQDADEFVVGVHRPDGSVDWKMVPKDVAESSAKAATAAATTAAPKQEATPQPAEQVADAAKPQEKQAAQQEEVAPAPEAVSEPQQAAPATTEPVQTAVAGTITRKTSAAEARAGQETEVAPQEAADVAETATAAQETAKQPPELTEKAFYDILESTAPLNTKAIAKKLGVSAEEVGALSAKAEKSGWLTRTEGGKLRRAHAKKRPSREDVEAIQAMAVAPSIIAGSPAAKTPKVSEKYADIKEAINEAALKMLPASVRVKMVDAIKIATKRATDQLLSARKGVTSERFPSAGARTGVPGLPTSASKQAKMGAADVSESGAARGLSAKDERIIRQESAAVGPDGKIIAGRRSRKAGASGRGGQNDTIQPVGVTEEFTTVAGMPGFVTAVKVSKAEARSGVLAKLTYRFYDKDNAPTADNIEMFVGNPQAQFELTQHEDGAWEFGWSFLVPELRKKGIGTKVYAALEKDLSIRMSPSGTLTEDGYAFWKKRSPASVQWHVQTPLWPGMYSSPRNISEEFERIGRELDRLTNPENTIASMTPAFRNELIENYLNDRKKLLKLLIKMPAEAKAARDSMFALPGFYSPAIRAAESLSQTKGTGEQFWKQITKTPGVKKDELDWMGLEEWLKDKKSVTKEELLTFMRANQIELENVELAQAKEEPAVRFQEYAPPGGSNYREFLILMPSLRYSYTPEMDARIDAIDAEIASLDKSGKPDDVIDAERRALYREQNKLLSAGQAPAYTSKHFEDQEIVHIRTDDREGENGEKILNIIEVQSDLHQAGRRVGYGDVGTENVAARKTKLESEVEKLLKEQEEPSWLDLPSEERRDRRRRIDALDAEIGELSRNVVPPDAPFKGDLWLELALKRVLQHAVENGYDAVIWSRSDQIARLVGADPDKLKLQYDKKIGKFFETYTNKWGGRVSETTIPSISPDVSLDTVLDRLADVREWSVQNISDFVSDPGNVLPYDEKVIAAEAARASTIAKVEAGVARMRAGEDFYSAFDTKPGPKALDYLGEELAAVFDRVIPEATSFGVNQQIEITDAMRRSIAEGQPLAMRRDPGEAEALGQTNPNDQIISLGMRAIELEAAMKGKSPIEEALRVFRHEVLEFFNAFGDAIFKPGEWAVLEKAARKGGWIETTHVRDAYENLYKGKMPDAELESILLKEAIAEQFSEYLAERKTYPKGIEGLFARLKDFITRVSNFLQGNGFNTWEDVFQKINKGEFKRRFEGEFPEQSEAVQRESMQLPGSTQIPDAVTPRAKPGTEKPQMSLTEIRDAVVEMLGLEVRRGRLDEGLKRAATKSGGELLGQYDPNTDIVRVREMNNIEVIFHEAGHQQINQKFKDRLGAEFLTAVKANAAELESLDPSGQQIVSEGFADFFRRYLLNHKIAKVKAPNFYAEFERLVKASNPGLLAAMQEIQKRVEEYQKAPSAGRVMSSVKSTVKSSTAKQVLEDIKKYGPYVSMKWAKDFRTYLQRVYHSRVSDTNWVHLWNIEAAKNAERNNKQLDFSFWKNAGKQAQQLNNAYSIGWADLTEGVHFIGSVRKGSVSFHDALTLAFGGEDRAQWSDEMLNAFGSYLAARRGRWLWLRFQPEASAQIQGTFTEPPQGQFQNGQWFVDASNNNTIRVWLNGRWEDELSHAPDKNSRADHEQTVASLEAEHPQFEEAAQLVYKFMRDWSLKEYQAGFLTDKAFSQRMQENDYVPWFRIMDKDGAYGPTDQKRKTPRNFRLHGSYRDFINPIESITRMVYEGNYNIKLNTMKRTMQEVAMASGVGYGHLAEPLNTTEARATKYNLFDALMSEAKKRGVTEVDAQSMLNAVIGHIGDNGSSTIFKRGDINERGDQIIYYLQKGEVKAFALADDDIGKGVFQFFQTLGDAPDFDSLVSWLAWPGKLMQIGITSHPRFQIWNLIRDQFQAPAMVPGYVPLISNAKTVVDNWYERSKDQGQPWNERLTANAGIMAGMNSAAQMEMRSNRDIKAMRKKGISLRPVKADFWLGTMNPFSHEFWRWTEWGESSTRQTIARIEFKHSKAELAKLYPGMPAEELEYIALEEAVFKSSNYVPYNRGGQKMSWLRQMIRFLNAGLQGMDRAFKVALLAEMDSGQWATPRAIKKGAKSLASLVMPWFKHCNNDPLTAAEKKALGRAFNYWSVILTIAVIQNLIRAMGDDDDDALKEELTDYQDTTYIHVSLPFTKDVVAFFPRGFDLVGITSNAISTAYDAQWKKDPTAKSKFVDSALKMVIPAHSLAGADMYSGIFENYNRFTDRPVVSDYLKAGRIPEDQHSPWVDPVSLSIGKTLGVSPNEVSFLMSKIGTQYYNDLTKVAIAASPNREALHWWEYPLVSSFFRDPSKYSKSKEKFYDVVKEYTQFAGSYGDRIKSRHPMEVKRYLDGLDPEVRAYVIAREHLDPDQKHLHPLMRMQAISKATNSIMRDIVTDRLPPAGDKKKEGDYVILSPTEKRDAFDALRGIEMREMRRTLITLGTPGWAQKRDDLLPPDKYYEQLKTALPKVWDIYQERTHGGRGGRDPMVYDFKQMKKMWPDIRRRLLDQNLEAEIVASRGNIELKTFRSEAREAMSMAD